MGKEECWLLRSASASLPEGIALLEIIAAVAPSPEGVIWPLASR